MGGSLEFDSINLINGKVSKREKEGWFESHAFNLFESNYTL